MPEFSRNRPRRYSRRYIGGLPRCVVFVLAGIGLGLTLRVLWLMGMGAV